MNNKVLYASLPYLPGIIFLLLWHFIVNGDDRLTFLFASPSAVYHVFMEDMLEAPIWYDIALTSYETLAGLVIGFTIGTIIAILLWFIPLMAYISKPYIVILGAIPIFSLAPLLIIWFGTGIMAKIVMAAFSVILVSLVQIYESTLNTNPKYIKVAQSFGASRWQILKTIVIPSSIKWMFVSLKLNVGFALIGAFIGEFISSSHGIGHYIIKAGGLYDVPRVLLGVLILSIIGLLLTKIISLISLKFFSRYLVKD